MNHRTNTCHIFWQCINIPPKSLVPRLQPCHYDFTNGFYAKNWSRNDLGGISHPLFHRYATPPQDYVVACVNSHQHQLSSAENRSLHGMNRAIASSPMDSPLKTGLESMLWVFLPQHKRRHGANSSSEHGGSS